MQMVHFIPSTQRRLAMLASQADTAPVLIYGASGSGKGGIARWIHAAGPRSTKPFLTASRDLPLSAQIPDAQGGTLVIPEIGEWPLGEQRVLLNFLMTRSVDSNGVRKIVNARIMATTDQALEGRAQAGLFNAELLEKLNVFRIEMPRLSQRGDDFTDIVNGLLGEITRELHKEHLRDISAEAWEKLKGYDWPGNLRELRNVMRVAIIAAKGDSLTLADLPDFGHDRLDFRATREQFEKTYIVELLKTFDWQIDRTCRMTQMDKGTLLAKIKKYGIPLEERSLS